MLYINKKSILEKDNILSKYKVFVNDYIRNMKRYIKCEPNGSFKIYHNIFGYRGFTNCFISNTSSVIKLI